MAIKRTKKRPEKNQLGMENKETVEPNKNEKVTKIETNEVEAVAETTINVSDIAEINEKANISDVSSIVGYDENNLKGKKQKPLVRKEINVDAKVAKVIFAIGDTVKQEEEFITSPINEILKTQGFSNGDISGQLYAMKQNGTLVNRPTQTEEEVTAFGKGARVWSTTEIFWSRFEKLSVAKEKATKINSDGETIEE